jgi:hypothetical protein
MVHRCIIRPRGSRAQSSCRHYRTFQLYADEHGRLSEADSARMTVPPYEQAVSRISSRSASQVAAVFHDYAASLADPVAEPRLVVNGKILRLPAGCQGWEAAGLGSAHLQQGCCHRRPARTGGLLPEVPRRGPWGDAISMLVPACRECGFERPGLVKRQVAPALRVPGPCQLRLGCQPHRPVLARHRLAPEDRGRRPRALSWPARSFRWG